MVALTKPCWLAQEMASSTSGACKFSDSRMLFKGCIVDFIIGVWRNRLQVAFGEIRNRVSEIAGRGNSNPATLDCIVINTMNNIRIAQM